MEGPIEEEGTGSTANTHVLGVESCQSPSSRPGKPGLGKGRRPPGFPQRKGSGSGPESWARYPGPNRGPKAGPNELTMAGGAFPSRQRVVALQPDPGWAIT